MSSDGLLKLPKLRASVIITTYNRAHLVSPAISSVLAAIRPGDEVIVLSLAALGAFVSGNLDRRKRRSMGAREAHPNVGHRLL